MKSATRVMVSTFGAFVGLAGIEHGIGEALQGSAPPSGLVFPSWPNSAFFASVRGEPALSLIPNLLITGVLAVVISLAFLAWAVLFVRRKPGGLVLILLSVPMLLAGGGIFPPVLGIITGAIATQIQAPWDRRLARLPAAARDFLWKAWPWSFGACVLAWLGMMPGTMILDTWFGVYNPDLILGLLYCMFGFLFLSCAAGFARDSRAQITAPGGSLRSVDPQAS